MAYQGKTEEELAMEALEQQRNEELMYQDYGIDTYQANMQEQPELASAGPTVEQEGEYTNVFAKMFGKVASVFGEDSSFGQMLKSMADKLEYNYGSAESAQAIQQEVVHGTSGGVSDGASSNDRVSYGELGEPEPKTDDFVDTKESKSEYERQTDAYVKAYQSDAKEATAEGDFLDMAANKDSSFSALDRNMRLVHGDLSRDTMVRLGGMDKTPQMKKDASENYMNLVRGLHAYDETAQQEIQEKYANDPEKMAQAQQGLSNMMNRSMTQAFGYIAQDNRTWDFLSKENVSELDAMQTSGMTQSFSEFAKANGYEDSLPKTETKQSAIGVESRMAGQKSEQKSGTSGSRGAEAEAMFDTVLQNEKASKEQSFTAGLER